MIMRSQIQGRRATILALFLAMNGQLAAFTPLMYHPLFSGWIVPSSLAGADEPDLSSPEEAVGAHKIMDHESKPIRMRAFRVISLQGRTYSRCILIEDVERAQFRLGSCSFESGAAEEMQAQIDRFFEAMQAELDRSDTWKVLHFLRYASRFPEDAYRLVLVANSIDAAVSQVERMWQEVREQVSQKYGKIPSSVPSEPEPTGKGSKPMIRAVRGGSSSEEGREQKELWDYAGGKRLEWKPVGNTPAGRKCEVLTFDGSEEVLVGPISIEIPTRSK
jgi:hypothetical protein